MEKIKCATFNKELQNAIPDEVRERMKADREEAEKRKNIEDENQRSNINTRIQSNKER